MEAIEPRAQGASRIEGLRIDPGAVVSWLVPALLIAYLGLRSGGYDLAARSETAMLVWWGVLVATAVGALPVAGGTRAGRLLFVALVAFAAWTALSLIWTQSAERTSIELGRVAAYLGVFALALGLQGRGYTRHLLHGVTAGIAVLIGLAALSRLQPGWFPEQTVGTFFPGDELERRLSYPLGYSSGLAALAAMAVPLLLAATASARTLAGQAVAAAALPVAALTLWLTGSSLAIPLVAAGLLAYLALAPDRLPKLASLLLAGVGSAIVIAAAEQLGALDRGLATAAAEREGSELLALLLVACAGVALAQTGLGLAVRHGHRPRWLRLSRRGAATVAGACVAATAIVAVAAGGPGAASDRWQDFKSPGGLTADEATRGAQIVDPSSHNRYQFWEAAVEASKTDPWIGIGPGTFEFWWAAEGTLRMFVRDAHSLYLETLAELGIVGLLLIGGFVVAVLTVALARVRGAGPEQRAALAAAAAGCAVFAVAAGTDWVWEMAVLPIAFLFLAAVALTGPAGEPAAAKRSSAAGPRREVAPRLSMCVGALVAIGAIAVPFVAGSNVDRSRDAVAGANLTEARADARKATEVQPYAATPRLQQALVLERQGRLGEALREAREATSRESANWRTWLTRSRLEARRGNARGALRAYVRAAALNPRSPLFAQ